MIIANPMYDVVFKRLMENERVAKFFIGTLMEQTIESLELRPQEFTYQDKSTILSVFRLDFIALIQDDEGNRKKVLIEIQKTRNQADVMRFRNYLAEQYKKKDLVDDDDLILPIVSIFILGFNLPEINSACIHVERQYRDMVEDKILTEKSEFIEQLTHDTFIVQALRIGKRYQTRLDRLLSLFEQDNFIDDSKIVKEFTYEAEEEEIKMMAEILYYTGTDPESRKNIEAEKEAWRTVNALIESNEKELRASFRKAQKEIEEQEKLIEEEKKKNEEQERKNEEQARLIEELKEQLRKKDEKK